MGSATPERLREGSPGEGVYGVSAALQEKEMTSSTES